MDLVVRWMDAWLGLSLCVGMPGWRLARLATMPFSKNSKHEFMRNSNILYIQNKMSLLVVCIFIINLMFTLFLCNIKCVFLYILRSGWRVHIIIFVLCKIHMQGAGQMPELHPDDDQSNEERGGLIPCPH